MVSWGSCQRQWTGTPSRKFPIPGDSTRGDAGTSGSATSGTSRGSISTMGSIAGEETRVSERLVTVSHRQCVGVPWRRFATPGDSTRGDSGAPKGTNADGSAGPSGVASDIARRDACRIEAARSIATLFGECTLPGRATVSTRALISEFVSMELGSGGPMPPPSVSMSAAETNEAAAAAAAAAASEAPSVGRCGASTTTEPRGVRMAASHAKASASSESPKLGSAGLEIEGFGEPPEFVRLMTAGESHPDPFLEAPLRTDENDGPADSGRIRAPSASRARPEGYKEDPILGVTAATGDRGDRVSVPAPLQEPQDSLESADPDELVELLRWATASGQPAATAAALKSAGHPSGAVAAAGSAGGGPASGPAAAGSAGSPSMGDRERGETGL